MTPRQGKWSGYRLKPSGGRASNFPVDGILESRYPAGTMDHIKNDTVITPEDGVKLAAEGFISLLGSPATTLAPKEVHSLGMEFAKRASSRMQRHLKIRELILEHVG